MSQIHELPVQQLSQGPADFRLAGTHETCQKNRRRSPFYFTSQIGVSTRKSKLSLLLDADFTTERTELNRGGTGVGSTCEGTASHQSIGKKSLLLKMKSGFD